MKALDPCPSQDICTHVPKPWLALVILCLLGIMPQRGTEALTWVGWHTGRVSEMCPSSLWPTTEQGTRCAHEHSRIWVCCAHTDELLHRFLHPSWLSRHWRGLGTSAWSLSPAQRHCHRGGEKQWSACHRTAYCPLSPKPQLWHGEDFTWHTLKPQRCTEDTLKPPLREEVKWNIEQDKQSKRFAPL